MSRPRENYLDRLRGREGELTVLDSRHRLLGSVRLWVFLAGVAMAFAAVNSRLFSPWWLLIPVALFLWLGQRLEAAEGERTRISRAVAYYQRGLARLDDRWAGSGETGERFLQGRRHLYAHDLDLFGRGSLFELLCHARTPMGQEVLAEWLLKPAPPETIAARHHAVAELAPRLDLREDLAVLGENARAGVHTAALCAWGEREPILRPSWFRGFAWGLSVLGAIGVVACLAYLMASLMLLNLPEKTMAELRLYFVSLGILYAAVLQHFRKRTKQVMREIEEAAPDLNLIAGVLGRLETEGFGAARLVRLRAELDSKSAPPSVRIAKLNRLVDLVDSRRNMAMAIFGPLLLWDLHLSYAIEDWRRISGGAVRPWLSAAGEMEALASIAGYSYERPTDVFPEWTGGRACFEGEGLGHPFLPEKQMVRNDVLLASEPSVLVVSGSNMSGKSTLLRAVGINAVLAGAGAPVCARRLRLSLLAVGASIRTEDSLQENTSRFYAEITQIRRILELAGEGVPVLFLMDEILEGTNSHDRRIGAEAIVQGLMERGAIGLLTTHDLALSQIAERLSPSAANVHFEDSLEGGRMHFDYRMRPGLVEKSNALELIRSMGLAV